MRSIGHNKGTEHPTLCLFFDTETRIENTTNHRRHQRHVWRLSCSIDTRFERGAWTRRHVCRHQDPGSLWRRIEDLANPSRPLWVFAHNLCFDLTIARFWDTLENGIFSLRHINNNEFPQGGDGRKSNKGKIVIGPKPTFLKLYTRKGKVIFVDSLNYLPMSLSEIGRSLHMPKHQLPSGSASDDDWYAYCTRDTEIVEAAITQLLQRWRDDDCGVWQCTGAMLGLTNFKHTLPKPNGDKTNKTIIMCHKREWEQAERDGYYGGQVSAFYVGKIDPADESTHSDEAMVSSDRMLRPRGPLYMLDAVSLYPSRMAQDYLPWKRCFSRQSPSVDAVADLSKAYGCLARVRIESTREEFTVRTANHQLQCSGRFWTVLCGRELDRAIQSGSVAEVSEAYFYSLDNVFKEWVEYWFDRRIKSRECDNEMDQLYCKMILNSLSGKWAQNGKCWVDDDRIPHFGQWGYATWCERSSNEVYRIRAIAGNRQKLVAGESPWYSFPAISAFITASGREWMREVRMKLPIHTCLYQATDSLLLTQEGYDALKKLGYLDRYHLGYFRLVRSGSDGDICGANHYRIGADWVRSGSWGNAHRNDKGEWVYTAFEGIDGIISRGSDGSILVSEHTIRGVPTYPKGVVGPDGWVIPYCLPDIRVKMN